MRVSLNACLQTCKPGSNKKRDSFNKIMVDVLNHVSKHWAVLKPLAIACDCVNSQLINMVFLLHGY